MKDEDIIKLTENEINKIERVNESFREHPKKLYLLSSMSSIWEQWL
jgi:hypothetical protein